MYCTVADVQAIASTFQVRFNESGGITTTQIESLIAIAQVRVNNILYTRYSPATIQAYAPTYPPMIVDLTAVIAAQLLFRRYASASFEHDNAIAKQLDEDRNLYSATICNGSLLDSTGALVVSLATTAPTLLQPDENEEVDALYANGVRQY